MPCLLLFCSPCTIVLNLTLRIFCSVYLVFCIRFLLAGLLLLANAYRQVEGVEQQYFGIQLVRQSRTGQGELLTEIVNNPAFTYI